MNLLEKKLITSFESMICFGEKIWFAEMDTNEIYYYDLQTEETVLFCEIIQEEPYGKRLFGTLIHNNGYLYLVPFSAKKIYKIRIAGKEIYEIDIDEPEKRLNEKYTESAKFLSAHLYGGIIYMIGASYPGIVTLDCNSDEVIYYTDWVDAIKKYSKQDDNAFFRKTALVGQKIYAPFVQGNAVLVFDVEKKQIEIKMVGDERCAYSSICYDGQEFWLAPRNEGPVVRWDLIENTSKLYNCFPDTCIHEKGSFSDIVYVNGDVFLLPMSANMGLKMDKQQGLLLAEETDNYSCMCQYSNCIYLYSKQAHSLEVINCDTGEKKIIELFLPDELIEKHRKHISVSYRCFNNEVELGDMILQEEYTGAIKDYFKYIQNKDEIYDITKVTNAVGENIYRLLV